MGNVVSAGLGQVSSAWTWHAAGNAALSSRCGRRGNIWPQAPARQAALGAGLPHSAVCTTVNKVCASGMKAVMLGAQSIQAGAPLPFTRSLSRLQCCSAQCRRTCAGVNDTVVAGGMESMSNMPYYLRGARSGLRMGHGQLTDGAHAQPCTEAPSQLKAVLCENACYVLSLSPGAGMILDGLWDPYNDVHMGACAETHAARAGISREEQDAHALASHERARRAADAGFSGRVRAPAGSVRRSALHWAVVRRPALHLKQDRKR